MNLSLQLVIICLSGLVLFWGFKSYRDRYVKMDLLISIVIAVGILSVGFLPAVFSFLGDVLDIRALPFTVSFFANAGLLLLVLYLTILIRNNRANINKLSRKISVEKAPKGEVHEDNVFVVLPAYNEGENIEKVLDSLPARVVGFDVEPLIVSDGSADMTSERARAKGATVVDHYINTGQGGAIKTGIDVAKRNGAGIVVTMDADGQHPAEELERLVDPIITGEADYVMGSRYRGKDYSGNGPVRRAGIRFFTGLINFLTKADVTDCTNGFRAIKGSALQSMTLTEERFSAPELIIEAKKNDLRIKEIPITIGERNSGETKKPKLGYAYGLLKTIMRTWIR